MKDKYILRAVGLGLLCASVVLCVASSDIGHAIYSLLLAMCFMEMSRDV